MNQINQSGLFEPVLVKRYSWSRAYSRGQYLKLLNTYSDHRSLDEAMEGFPDWFNLQD